MRDLLSWRLFSYTPLFVCALLFPQRIYQLVRADRPYWSFDFFPHTLRPSIETIIVDFTSHLLPSAQFTWCNGLRLNRQLSLPLFFSTRPCNRIKNSLRKGQIKQKKTFDINSRNEKQTKLTFGLLSTYVDVIVWHAKCDDRSPSQCYFIRSAETLGIRHQTGATQPKKRKESALE